MVEKVFIVDKERVLPEVSGRVQNMVDLTAKVNPTMGGQGPREEVEGDGQADQESQEGKENQEST